MSREIVITILIPSCIVSVSLLAMALMMKLRRRRKRRTMERGVTDFLRQVRSLKHCEGSCSNPTQPKAGRAER
jgi:hypothetical protein